MATIGVLGAILGVPVLSGLFLFATPSPAMLLAGVGAAGLSLFWFEVVKWRLGRRIAPAASESSPR